MSTDIKVDPAYVDKLAQDLQRQFWGQALLPLEAIVLGTPYSERLLREAISRGELTASRNKEGGRIVVTTRALAAWIALGEAKSLPKPTDDFPAEPQAPSAEESSSSSAPRAKGSRSR